MTRSYHGETPRVETRNLGIIFRPSAGLLNDLRTSAKIVMEGAVGQCFLGDLLVLSNVLPATCLDSLLERLELSDLVSFFIIFRFSFWVPYAPGDCLAHWRSRERADVMKHVLPEGSGLFLIAGNHDVSDELRSAFIQAAD